MRKMILVALVLLVIFGAIFVLSQRPLSMPPIDAYGGGWRGWFRWFRDFIGL